MGPVEVIVMQPVFQLLFSFGGVLVRASIGPLAQCGLDEAFRLAVGARRVGPGKPLFEMELGHQFAIEPVSVAGAVITVDAADGDAEATKVGAGHQEEAYGRAVALIGQDRSKTDAGVVVNGDVQILPARATSLTFALTRDPMPRAENASQTLDVEVNQVARALMLIAHHWGRRIERAQAIHPGAAQQAANSRPAELEFAGNAPAAPARATKSQNPF